MNDGECNKLKCDFIRTMVSEAKDDPFGDHFRPIMASLLDNTDPIIEVIMMHNETGETHQTEMTAREFFVAMAEEMFGSEEDMPEGPILNPGGRRSN